MALAWERVDSPEALGLSGQAVLDFLRDSKRLSIHTLAIVRDHKAYVLARRPFRADSPHTLFSLSKSFCSMAAGMAVDEGLLRYDDRLTELLSDSLPKGYDRRLDQVTLHHLLSMSSGLDEKSDHEIRSSYDWARSALACKVQHTPGTHFHYNTMGTYLAGRMVARRANMSLRDYLMPRLFEPLGIVKPQWDCCPMGYNAGGFGLHLGMGGLAKAAQLLLDGGVWQGRRLLSADYLARATVCQIDNRNPDEKDPHPDWSSGYGYQFWMARKGRFRGDGMFGQVMMVDWDNNLAVCCTAGTNLMGDELDTLHRLMDGLLTLPPQDGDGRAALRLMEKRPVASAPRDGGEEVGLEGSYRAGDGKTLRVETPDVNTLRLFLEGGGLPYPIKFTFSRRKAHRGEFMPWPQGERPQAYLGRFGVWRGALGARVVMPEAPYRLLARLEKTEDGLLMRVDSIGLWEGEFRFVRTDRNQAGGG